MAEDAVSKGQSNFCVARNLNQHPNFDYCDDFKKWFDGLLSSSISLQLESQIVLRAMENNGRKLQQEHSLKNSLSTAVWCMTNIMNNNMKTL